MFTQASTRAACICLQATTLSMADPATLPKVDKAKGLTPTALQPLLGWFHNTFQQLPPPARLSATDAEDLAAAANGLQAVVEQLQAVAVAKQGTAEQLQAVFVALCRAQGLLVRSVRCVVLVVLTDANTFCSVAALVLVSCRICYIAVLSCTILLIN